MTSILDEAIEWLLKRDAAENRLRAERNSIKLAPERFDHPTHYDFRPFNLWLDRYPELRPPIVDHDPGDEQPRFRIQSYNTAFGNVRTCRVCFTVNDYTALDHSRCRACHVELTEAFVPVTFRRAELFGL